MSHSPVTRAINLIGGGHVSSTSQTALIQINPSGILAHPWGVLLYCTRDASIFDPHPNGLRIKDEHHYTNSYNVAKITGLGVNHHISWDYLDQVVMTTSVDDPGVLTTLLKLRTVTRAQKYLHRQLKETSL